jgi:hypothetical protein
MRTAVWCSEGRGTTFRRGRENLERAAPCGAWKTPVKQEALPVTIVWILIVIILVLLVIALARRVL